MTFQCCPSPGVGPSVLDCDMAQLAVEAKRALNAGASYLHLDVMDGHFVPNISFGPYVIECLRKHVPDVFFDCHMMTSIPENWVEKVARAKGNRPGLICYTFHYEATEPRGKTQEVIDLIKSHNMKVGLTVSPDTPVEALLKYADQIDLALVMTVYPGRGGQSFIEEMMDKVRTLRAAYPDLDIEVDGGVKPKTVDMATKAGANLIVSGSGVYKATDMAESISVMQRSVDKHALLKSDDELSPIRTDAAVKAAEETVATLVDADVDALGAVTKTSQ
jgi:ribulose-phosphate 3-epimerase